MAYELQIAASGARLDRREFLKLSMMSVALVRCGGNFNTSVPDEPPTLPVRTTGRVVFIGDSITEWWPLQDYVIDAINVGVSGNLTSKMLARFDQDVLSWNPAGVSILGGINDLRRTGTLNMSNLFTMVQKAQTAGVTAILGTLLPCECSPQISKLVAEVNETIRASAARYGYFIAEYYDRAVHADGTIRSELFDDGVHPNLSGYDAMWPALWSALSESRLV